MHAPARHHPGGLSSLRHARLLREAQPEWFRGIARQLPLCEWEALLEARSPGASGAEYVFLMPFRPFLFA